MPAALAHAEPFLAGAGRGPSTLQGRDSCLFGAPPATMPLPAPGYVLDLGAIRPWAYSLVHTRTHDDWPSKVLPATQYAYLDNLAWLGLGNLRRRHSLSSMPLESRLVAHLG